MRGWLGQCLTAYRSAERALVTWMQDRLTADQHEQPAVGYRATLARAPTRPHPRGPHAGWPGCLAFRFQARWDAVLDAMDSRPGVTGLR